MSATKCSSKNPSTCRYHGHEEQVAIATEQKRVAEANKDFEGYFKASKTLEALEKKKQVVKGLDAALQEAQETGDFNRYFELTQGIQPDAATEEGHARLAWALGVEDSKPDAAAEDGHARLAWALGVDGSKPAPIDFRKRRPYSTYLGGSDGNEYLNALHPAVFNAEGDVPPSHIYSEDEYGNDRAFVRADEFSHQDYPNVMRLQASRALTDEEVAKVAQLTGFTHRKTLNGEGLSDPERDGNAAVILSTDNTKSYGRKSQFGPFEDKLGDILRDGSDIRTTNRSGPDTKGTRLVEGIGKDVSFTLYYQDDSVKFNK